MDKNKEVKSLDEVKTQEQGYIQERRKKALGSLANPAADAQNTIGLALSGGGMRSATFNLGIVQELARLGLLPWVDYLSTVSGGGYIGNCLTALLSMRTINLPAGTQVWAAPWAEALPGDKQGSHEALTQPLEAELVGKEWWYIKELSQDKEEGWISAYPNDVFEPDASSTKPYTTTARQKMLVCHNPETMPEAFYCIPVGDQLEISACWGRVRYKSDPDCKIFKTGWVKITTSTEMYPKEQDTADNFKFNVTNRFPFKPDYPAFDRAVPSLKSTSQPVVDKQSQAVGSPNPDAQGINRGKKQLRNHQLYHLRLNGNFIIPRSGILKQDTLRSIGAVVAGISRMVFIFAVIFLIIAAAHYVLAALLAPDITQTLTFAASSAPTPSAAGQQPQVVVLEFSLNGATTITDGVKVKLEPELQTTPPVTETITLKDWVTVIFLQKENPAYDQPKPPSELKIPLLYWVFLAAGALTAIFTYIYIARFNTGKGLELLPNVPGLSRSEYKAKLILRDCLVFSLVVLVLLSISFKTVWLQVLINSQQNTTGLYWLWLPAAFVLGHWFVITFIYLLFSSDQVWHSEFRSTVSSWQGINTYGLLIAILFAILALPYAVRLPGSEGVSSNVTLLAMTTVISGAWSYFLAGGLAKQIAEGWFSKIPAGLRAGLLNTLVVILAISAILLLGTLFEQMPVTQITPPESAVKVNLAFYTLTGGAIGIISLFLLMYVFGKLGLRLWGKLPKNGFTLGLMRWGTGLINVVFRFMLSLLFLYLLTQVILFTLGWFNISGVAEHGSQTQLPFSIYHLMGVIWMVLCVVGLIFISAFFIRILAGLWLGKMRPWLTRKDINTWFIPKLIGLLILIIMLIIAWIYLYYGLKFDPGPPWDDPQWFSVLMIGAFACLVFVLVSQYVNLNRISFHYFYRDCLSDTFLRTNRVTNHPEQVIPTRDQSEIQIQDINPDGSPAPYHLIVTTLNLPGSKSLTYKDSKSESFIFSRYFCGSNKTHYFPTHLYQGGLTRLARAMTISGAAANSTLGQYTFFAQAFIMTLFNVRLGYWMDNPQQYDLDEMLSRNRKQDFTQLESSATLTYESNAFWAKYLWRELSGTAHDQDKLINLSDGGHTDNLGLYPLLQRRCRLIIVGDAGCDPESKCDDLARVIRRIYSEDDVVIEINLDLLKPDSDGLSKSHCAVGKIFYPPPNQSEDTGSNPEIGWLIYLKPAITGDEEGSIKSYWWNHRPDQFPHQSTADQFYDEDQFESYRRLGEHTIKSVIDTLNSYYKRTNEGYTFKILTRGKNLINDLTTFKKEDDSQRDALLYTEILRLYQGFKGIKQELHWYDDVGDDTWGYDYGSDWGDERSKWRIPPASPEELRKLAQEFIEALDRPLDDKSRVSLLQGLRDIIQDSNYWADPENEAYRDIHQKFTELSAYFLEVDPEFEDINDPKTIKRYINDLDEECAKDGSSLLQISRKLVKDTYYLNQLDSAEIDNLFRQIQRLYGSSTRSGGDDQSDNQLEEKLTKNLKNDLFEEVREFFDLLDREIDMREILGASVPGKKLIETNLPPTVTLDQVMGDLKKAISVYKDTKDQTQATTVSGEK